MFRGYNLKVNKLEFEDYLSTGRALYVVQKNNVKKELKKFLSTDGIIDASKLQENWFPQVEADVFISHSHDNEDLAVALSGWLFHNFRIRSFVDSCIWDYANDLLKEIDDEYCTNGKGSYSYESRNYSTSHVHMMLSTALSKMIDKTECLFFLNTPESVTVEDIVDSKTNSPWIYSEISITEIIRKKIPERHKQGTTKLFSKGGIVSLNENKKFKAEYILKLGHLTEISDDDLTEWKDFFETLQRDRSLTALDCLYKQTPVDVRYNKLIYG
jgi:hypothetical protein